MTDAPPAPLSHVVLIRLDPTAPAEAADAIGDDLRNLVHGHPLIRRGTVSRDRGLRSDSDRSATWLAIMDFDGPADFSAYLESAPHRDFLRQYGDVIAALLAAQVDSPAVT